MEGGIQYQSQDDISSPVACYNISFLDESKQPMIYGKCVEQRVWIIICRVPAISPLMWRRVQQRIEKCMDYKKYFDPFWNTAVSKVTMYYENKVLHIVLDTVMNREMRRDVLNTLGILDINVELIMLATRDLTTTYEIPEEHSRDYDFLNNMVLSQYEFRRPFRTETKHRPEYAISHMVPIMKVSAKNEPDTERRTYLYN